MGGCCQPGRIIYPLQVCNFSERNREDTGRNGGVVSAMIGPCANAQNEHPIQPLWSENTSTKEEAESRSTNGNCKGEKRVRGVISGRASSGCKCLETGERVGRLQAVQCGRSQREIA